MVAEAEQGSMNAPHDFDCCNKKTAKMMRPLWWCVFCLWRTRWTLALTPDPSVTTKHLRHHHSNSLSSSPLFVVSSSKRYRPYYYPDDEELGMPRQYDELSTRSHMERPTDTLPQRPAAAAIVPDRPHIVVLGASGQIGSRVVRQLLESNLDVTIVAFVRDYDKACRVLYDDVLVANAYARRNRRGPQLQIVQGDLVPPEALPQRGGRRRTVKDDDSIDWQQRHRTTSSPSAAAAVDGAKKNRTDSYDDDNNNESLLLPRPPHHPDEALREAIRGCTTVISCIGATRPTHVWHDYLARPLTRIGRHDVSRWCADPTHPYYIHVVSTRHVLRLCEREQQRREAAQRDNKNNNGSVVVGDDDDDDVNIPPRIRLIRISDLCVAQRPYHLVPVLTNMLQSVVFRYQAMADRLLAGSTMVDTISLRPGDLCNDERNVATTSLQVCPSGPVPTPARIGRDDVASLAIAAALHHHDHQPADDDKQQQQQKQQQPPRVVRPPAFHYTLACRWVGQHLAPYPAQGRQRDGLPHANLCIPAAVRKIKQDEKRGPGRSALAHHHHQHRRSSSSSSAGGNFKPTRLPGIPCYGICTAVPVYVMLTLLGQTLFWVVAPYLARTVGRSSTLHHARRFVARGGAPMVRPIARWLSRPATHVLAYFRWGAHVATKHSYISF